MAHLQERGLVEDGGNRVENPLTWEGWEEVEPLAGSVPGLGFVAMAFRDDLKEAFDDGIVPAIESDCGFRAVRVDREHLEPNEKICDRIITEIRRCQFVVADFTHNRGAVYFEAGFALALGRTVIWSCREDHVGDLCFDTRQYPHILWKQPQDLRSQLSARLRYLVPGARLS